MTLKLTPVINLSAWLQQCSGKKNPTAQRVQSLTGLKELLLKSISALCFTFKSHSQTTAFRIVKGSFTQTVLQTKDDSYISMLPAAMYPHKSSPVISQSHTDPSHHRKLPRSTVTQQTACKRDHERMSRAPTAA